MSTVHSLISSIDSLGAPLLALLGLWATVVLGFAWVVDSRTEAQQALSFSSSESAPIHAPWSMPWVGIWGLGVVLHLTWLAGSWLRARRLVRGAASFQRARFDQQLCELALRFSVKGC